MSIDITDIELSKYLKQGDARSFELIFRRLYPRLCAFAQKFLHDPNDAQEIVQEVFLTLWKNCDRIDENQSLQAYLFTSVKNRCLNLLESKKLRSKHAETLWFLYVQQRADNNNSYHTLLTKDLERDFNTALETLPQECRKIFELSRFEGLQYKEIATKLDISIKTVETQMSRALMKLRIQLHEHLAMLVLITIII